MILSAEKEGISSHSGDSIAEINEKDNRLRKVFSTPPRDRKKSGYEHLFNEKDWSRANGKGCITTEKTLRKSFARHEEVLDMPNLLEIQKKSYQWFLDTGLQEVFRDVAAIGDYAGNLELSFIDFTMDEKPSTL